MTHLVPCPSCQRHVKNVERSCPFCGDAFDLGSVAEPVLPRTRLGRAAIFAFRATLIGATAIAAEACGGGSDDDEGSGQPAGASNAAGENGQSGADSGGAQGSGGTASTTGGGKGASGAPGSGGKGSTGGASAQGGEQGQGGDDGQGGKGMGVGGLTADGGTSVMPLYGLPPAEGGRTDGSGGDSATKGGAANGGDTSASGGLQNVGGVAALYGAAPAYGLPASSR